jgi:hypothetical protein
VIPSCSQRDGQDDHAEAAIKPGIELEAAGDDGDAFSLAMVPGPWMRAR